MCEKGQTNTGLLRQTERGTEREINGDRNAPKYSKGNGWHAAAKSDIKVSADTWRLR